MGTMVPVFVEAGVDMATTGGVAAWSFDLPTWGRCGQGATEAEALEDLGAQCDHAGEPHTDVEVVERIEGDEQAFDRDHRPPRPEEIEATLSILEAVRPRTIGLVAEASEERLDHDDPARTLPEWASWRTARQMAWHIADTESRYYLPSVGLPSRPRAGDLVTELRESHLHVCRVLAGLTAEPIVVRQEGEAWTTVKLLRRLAWHERSELAVLQRLLLA